MDERVILCWKARTWAKVVASLQIAFNLPILMLIPYASYWIVRTHERIYPAVLYAFVEVGQIAAAVLLIKGVRVNNGNFIKLWLGITSATWIMGLIVLELITCGGPEYYLLLVFPSLICIGFAIWMAIELLQEFGKNYQASAPALPPMDFQELSKQHNFFPGRS